MTRRFARFRAAPPLADTGFSAVPSDGMCLSVFLVLRAPEDPGRVLLGRLSPDPQWAEVGALDTERAARIGDRWMLPSRQLLLFESPDEAARRVGEEQLGIDLGPLDGPEVFSETYSRSGSTETDPHWDLHFIYSLPGPPQAPRSPLWKELSYVPVAATPRTALARNHGDILELAGLTPAP